MASSAVSKVTADNEQAPDVFYLKELAGFVLSSVFFPPPFVHLFSKPVKEKNPCTSYLGSLVCVRACWRQT